MLKSAEFSRAVNSLVPFGCNPREAAVYLRCLELGPSSIQDLARSLNYNRVTVHSSVEQLIEKGLLYESRKGKRRLIGAEPPSSLSQILQKRQNELDVQRLEMTELIDQLERIQKIDTAVPTVKFYEGVDGFKRMLEETLTAKGEVLVFTYVILFSKLVGTSYLENYFQRRAAKGIKTRLIFPPCPFAQRVNKRAVDYRISIRLLPSDMKWSAGIFSWNDCIALMSYTEHKLTTTIVENRDIAQFYRTILFELTWLQGKPI